jgi:hypothetical protein
MNYTELLALSDKQQSKIAELKKGRNTLDNQLHELYHAMELISKIATVAPVDTAILEVINCYRAGELLQANNLEQRAKGAESFVKSQAIKVQGFSWYKDSPPTLEGLYASDFGCSSMVSSVVVFCEVLRGQAKALKESK